jgi:hypothetical protein
MKSDECVTGEDMCTYIADWLELKGVPRPTNAAIWTMGYRGELFPVYGLFWQAKMEREGLDMIVDMRHGPTLGNITWRPMGGEKPRVIYVSASSAADAPPHSPPAPARPESSR